MYLNIPILFPFWLLRSGFAFWVLVASVPGPCILFTSSTCKHFSSIAQCLKSLMHFVFVCLICCFMSKVNS